MSALISPLAVNVFDHSQRHRAVLSRRESVRPRQIRFFLSEETPPALSGPAHSFSRNPGACNKRSGTLRNFLKQPFFYPHSLPDTPHFSFGGMTTTALPGSAHPFSRNPDTRDETLRHLAAFSQATVFLPRILCLTRRIFFRQHGISGALRPGRGAFTIQIFT